ncbi:hypothetical protein CVT26_008005 [Gymnopilus dilepis]|uniref:Uncharacterized protein n=1 Tax=Gymnopilus dilepis TaxID=231916 RepID=A0A409YKP6_9AGAR|nr:hypothetical protein CVT26_008005 [Gymnopilus dilepis]
MSEIDDIFASKGKQKQPPLLSSEKKKKKKKKKADPPSPKADVVAPTSKKRPLPETVVDTSDRLPGPSKRHKGSAAPPPADDSSKKSKKVDKKKAEADEDFKDSRGSDSRRRTEEGWSIYKEDELGIGDQGGGKPQYTCCPIFFVMTLVQTPLCVLSIVIAVFEYNKCMICFLKKLLSSYLPIGLFRSLSNQSFTIGEVNV